MFPVRGGVCQPGGPRGSQPRRAGLPVRAVRGAGGLRVPAQGPREDPHYRGHAVQPVRQGCQG